MFICAPDIIGHVIPYPVSEDCVEKIKVRSVHFVAEVAHCFMFF